MRNYKTYPKYTSKEVIKNPKLTRRLKKIEEENLPPKTREFIVSLLDFFNKNGGLTENQLSAFEKIESRWSPQEKIKLEANSSLSMVVLYSYSDYLVTILRI